MRSNNKHDCVCIVCRVQHLWSSQFRRSPRLTLAWCSWDTWRVTFWSLLLAAAISVTLKGRGFGEWGIRSAMENMALVFYRSSRPGRGHQAPARPISCTVLVQARAFGRPTSVERCLAPISLNSCSPAPPCRSSAAGMWCRECLAMQYHKYFPPETAKPLLNDHFFYWRTIMQHLYDPCKKIYIYI